jgi:carbon-monoxide dehydrogenase small subunit
MKIEICVNGQMQSFFVDANELLINLLRNDMHLTGTKYGCGIGECGACTVYLDSEPILACLTLAVSVNGKRIDTIESISKSGQLDPIQEAYLEEGAVQCGFCTPGFIMMTNILLKESPQPREDEIREYLRGNYCRCTGYVNILKAVRTASKKLNTR